MERSHHLDGIFEIAVWEIESLFDGILIYGSNFEELKQSSTFGLVSAIFLLQVFFIIIY